MCLKRAKRPSKKTSHNGPGWTWYEIFNFRNELVCSRFNPANQLVTYMSYFKNMPRVYLLDIETGIQEVVGTFLE